MFGDVEEREVVFLRFDLRPGGDVKSHSSEHVFDLADEFGNQVQMTLGTLPGEFQRDIDRILFAQACNRRCLELLAAFLERGRNAFFPFIEFPSLLFSFLG